MIMTKLSPAAQAIYDSFNRVWLHNEPSFVIDRKALAASFRTIADQLHSEWDATRCQVFLDAIADELESQ